MNDLAHQYRLNGLEPDNLLAFLAVLGLLRTLEAVRPDWRPRARWDLEKAPLRPILVLSEAHNQQAISEAAAQGAKRLAIDYNFPAEAKDAGSQADLDYSRDYARRLLEQASSENQQQRSDLWGALMSDAAEREDGRIEPTPLCLLFGQGHQHFLDRLSVVPRTEAPPARGRGKTAKHLTATETMHEALFQPWSRQDPTPAFRWDPAEDVRYALRADNPSGVKSTTQHGGNRLAALGLPALTVTPMQRGARVRLQLLGGTANRDGFTFAWPIWREPASLAAIRAMLSHPQLQTDPAALAHLGSSRSARRGASMSESL
jgi:hypothetical protein